MEKHKENTSRTQHHTHTLSVSAHPLKQNCTKADTHTHTRKKNKCAERWHALCEHCSRVMHL